MPAPQSVVPAGCLGSKRRHGLTEALCREIAMSRTTRRRFLKSALLAACGTGASGLARAQEAGDLVAIPVEELEDKIRGGLLGQLLGNLNGLPHEMQYIDQPGDVALDTPALPQGAWTDDDTDIEWVYVVAMQRDQTILLPPERIVRLWQRHVNRSIWCANAYARQLMDLGIEPPWTGQIALNPWSDFNISGQFLCESFGLMAPALPQTAARIGLHYVHVAIEGEPAQATQLFATMIATAFTTEELDLILDAGLAAVDPDSQIHKIAAAVRRWHRQHPADWRATRRLIQQTYSKHDGAMRDRNGYELNTAATLGALLYGRGDFVETLRLAFNFGWDADNNAATAATIVGVIQGHRWMRQQGWTIRDRYENRTRVGMPTDETITRFGDRLIGLAERVITTHGGQKATVAGRTVYRIRAERPANVEPLPDPAAQGMRLQTRWKPEIQAALARGGPEQDLARAAYLAVCLDLAGPLRAQHAAPWSRALAALRKYPDLLRVLFESRSLPIGAQLHARAVAAGLGEVPGPGR
jgi:ADP-ribosylglycohydrolase